MLAWQLSGAARSPRPFTLREQERLVALIPVLSWDYFLSNAFIGFAGGDNNVRAGHQPQDRQGPRPDDPAVNIGAGGRSDSVTRPVLRVSRRTGRAPLNFHIMRETTRLADRERKEPFPHARCHAVVRGVSL
jgi:hypothetical protein